MSPHDPITWFEIPTRDLDRAQRFYEALLGQPMRRERMGDADMAVFPGRDGGVGGCLHQAPDGSAPAAQGTLVYLDVAPSIGDALARATGAGGRVLCPATMLPGDLGVYAHVEDSEGNRVGLHAPA